VAELLDPKDWASASRLMNSVNTPVMTRVTVLVFIVLEFVEFQGKPLSFYGIGITKYKVFSKDASY
jgi:hypothetical protein